MAPGEATCKVRVPSTTPTPSKGHHPEPRRACPGLAGERGILYNGRQSSINSPRTTSFSEHEDGGEVSLEMEKSGPLEPPQVLDLRRRALELQRQRQRNDRDRKSQTREGEGTWGWKKGRELYLLVYRYRAEGRGPGPCQG